MPATSYFVKRDPGLFRKTRWSVLLDNLKIGDCASREEAQDMAVGEAQRSADLGRVVEVWVNNGEGFVLFKSFQPVKKKKGKDGDEDSDEGSGLGEEPMLGGETPF